jgi:UDP-glucose:(heptosyl)LPS alpha-1,3-glucosyltransferase
MKIALAIERFSKHAGGAEAYGVDLAGTLIDHGWQVHLFGYEWDGAPKGAIFHQIRRPPEFLPASLKILHFALSHARMIRKGDYDIVLGFGNTLEMNVYQSHGGVHHLSSTRKLRALNSSIHRNIKHLLMRVSPKYHARKWIESSAFRKDPRPVIIAISDMIKRDMIEHYKLAQDEVRVIYNGVDPGRFDLESCSGGGLRSDLGFTDEVLFLFMAYDFRKKGVRQFLAAAATLKERRPEKSFGLVIVGREPPREIMAQVKRLGLDNIVRFPGSTKTPEGFYKACDVFVLPTFYDACSLVVFEAMMSGLPCITTLNNGAAGVIADGLDGSVLADPWNREEFARAMEAYLDAGHLKRASSEARRKAQQYTLKKNHMEMLKVFHEVASKALE